MERAKSCSISPYAGYMFMRPTTDVRGSLCESGTRLTVQSCVSSLIHSGAAAGIDPKRLGMTITMLQVVSKKTVTTSMVLLKKSNSLMRLLLGSNKVGPRTAEAPATLPLSLARHGQRALPTASPSRPPVPVRHTVSRVGAARTRTHPALTRREPRSKPHHQFEIF